MFRTINSVLLAICFAPGLGPLYAEEKHQPSRTVARADWNKYGLDDLMRNELDIKDRGIAEVYFRLNELAKLHVGIEVKELYKDRKILQIPAQKTLRQVLDIAVQQDPGYFWEISRGVINILPRGTQEDKYARSVLNLRLDKFVIKDGEAFTAVRQLSKQASKHGLLAFPGVSDDPGLRELLRRINISLENPTLRDCLNEIVKNDGFWDWLVQPHPRKRGAYAFMLKSRPGVNDFLNEQGHKKAREAVEKAKRKKPSKEPTKGEQIEPPTQRTK